MKISYSILDPTGNITILVEDPVETAKQPALAAALMDLHPEAEQVGFVRPADGDGLPALRMAGGEFCGNASMCAAALLLANAGQESGDMLLRVSGASRPVSLRLRPEGESAWHAEICMPPALEITQKPFSFGNISGTLPLVRLEGISHLIVEQESPFFSLLGDRPAAESAVRQFCVEIHADGLGLLFLEDGDDARRMTPLVHIPGSGTVFWENSCASGSAAVGIYLAAKTGTPVSIILREPGGELRVVSEPERGETWLHGSVRLVGRFTREIQVG